jgi:hypothetical protein
MEKIEIARRELGSALHLFLGDYCPVSVHVLASAGGEITQGLADKAGGHAYREALPLMSPPQTERSVNDAMRLFSNAFKHLEKKDGTPRDDTHLFEIFSDEDNAGVLFKGWAWLVLHARMSASEAKAAIFGSHCHVAEGPAADLPNLPTAQLLCWGKIRRKKFHGLNPSTRTTYHEMFLTASPRIRGDSFRESASRPAIAITLPIAATVTAQPSRSKI